MRCVTVRQILIYLLTAFDKVRVKSGQKNQTDIAQSKRYLYNAMFKTNIISIKMFIHIDFRHFDFLAMLIKFKTIPTGMDSHIKKIL